MSAPRVSSLRRSPTTLRKLPARISGGVGRAAIVAAFGLGTLAPAGASTYRGTLVQPGVVWISDGSAPAPPVEAEMRNVHKAFVPALLVITAGSSVRFPNDDGFFHSIYSAGPPDPFDIGFYDNGPGKTVGFGVAGVVTVRCHVHGSMHATIVVVDGPWAQTPAPNQPYVLTNVRPGKHTLHVWSSDGEKTSSIEL